MSMKMTQMKKMTMWHACAGALLMLLSATAQAGNTTTFTWTVDTASCEVSTDPVGMLSLGPVNVESLYGAPNWTLAGPQDLSIIISDCNAGYNIGSGTPRPSVKVSGTTPTLRGYTNKWLFKDDGDSQGVYIQLNKTSNDAGDQTGEIEVMNNSYLYIPKPGGNFYLPGDILPVGETDTIKLSAGVSCGKKGTGDMCKRELARAGSLQASFAFSFEYK